MTEEELMREKLQAMARWIKEQLPSKDWGFILFAFTYGPLGNMLYVANAQRDDVVQALREFIAKNSPKEYGTDRDETDADRIFEKWWNKEVGRVSGACPTEWATVRQLAFDAFMAGMVWSIE